MKKYRSESDDNKGSELESKRLTGKDIEKFIRELESKKGSEGDNSVKVKSWEMKKAKPEYVLSANPPIAGSSREISDAQPPAGPSDARPVSDTIQQREVIQGPGGSTEVQPQREYNLLRDSDPETLIAGPSRGYYDPVSDTFKK